MEFKLFLVGCVVGIYWLALRSMDKNGRLSEPKTCALMHGVFGALAAFIVLLLVSVLRDSGTDSSPETSSPLGKAALWAAVIIAVFGWNFLRKRRASKKALDAVRKSDLEWAETISSSMLLASAVMFFLVQAFQIPSGSMRVTLLEGDHLFVNKIGYGIRTPFTGRRLVKFRTVKRGDIIVFRFPSEDPKELQCDGSQYGRDFIKRVVGVPGDTIAVRGGQLIRNGQPVPAESYAQYTDIYRIPGPKIDDPSEFQKQWETRELGRLYGSTIRDNFGPVTVPQGQYFAMGDNRDRSCDSRFWGPVPEQNIKGSAMFIYWPPTRIAAVH
jgi:signal peptidase I